MPTGGTSFEEAGLGEVRPDVGICSQYEFDGLPPVPFEMRGDFGWLALRQIFDHSIGDEWASEVICRTDERNRFVFDAE